jgi:endonuclease III
MKRSLSPLTPPSSPSKLTPAAKKLKIASDYASASPYPALLRPTEKEARDVCSLLSETHGETPKKYAQTCGESPNVIESLISTILSQNTSNKNSSAAKACLDKAFGRNNFEAIVKAPTPQVVDALRCGGLANKKAVTIQKILQSVHERHGSYSLQHLSEATRTDAEITSELLSYAGVGPKTASCVLLFCLGRQSFAVDTHVFRLSKMLGWVPEKADRVLAQAHLEQRIPAEIKLDLHVLMIRHGRACKGCNSRGNAGKDSCVLKKYMREIKIKGGYLVMYCGGVKTKMN